MCFGGHQVPIEAHCFTCNQHTPPPANHCDNQKCLQAQGSSTTSQKNYWKSSYSYMLGTNHLLSWQRELRRDGNVISPKSSTSDKERASFLGSPSHKNTHTHTPPKPLFMQFFHSLFSNSAVKALPIGQGAGQTNNFHKASFSSPWGPTQISKHFSHSPS